MSRLFLISALALAIGVARAEAGDLTRKEKTAAKRLYENKCTKCHRLYEPNSYSQEEWDLWMTRMSNKAKLKPSQKTLLNRYLDAARPNKPQSKD